MMYLVENLFDEINSKNIIQQVMMSENWKDGNMSAKYKDKNHKKNLQLNENSIPDIANIVKQSILNNKKITNTCFPRHIHSLMFTRTGPGMHYGAHTDSAIIKAGRRDLSFTLFLAERDSFEGGELTLYIPPETKTVLLDQGQAIFYPTKYIHEVKPVVSGERMVCVGWIESEIPEHEDREILSSINTSLSHIESREHFLKAQNAYWCLYKRFSR